MADDEAIFVGIWTQKWSKIPNPQKLQAGGVVRRLHVGSLLGKTLPRGSSASTKLIDAILSDLKSTLKTDAIYWSPAPGLIDIFYPNMLPQAADLSHSVLSSTITRRIHDMVVAPARAATLNQPAAERTRRVNSEDFQRLSRKAQVRPDQIQSIDVSELILGKPDPDAHLSRRSWQIAETVLDDFLAHGGYYAQQPGNQILLLFPGLSASLARIKRNAIANDIEALAKEAAGPIETVDDDARPEAEVKRPSAAVRANTKISPQDAKEIADFNKAFAAMASASSSYLNEENRADIPADTIYRVIPVWRAKNQTLVGHVVSASSPLGPDAISAEALDLANLSRAQADVHEGVAAQSPRLVLTSLHWSTLDRLKTRNRYAELASKLSDEGRRYLVIVVRDIPDDLMFARVEERLRDIKRFCRSISCLVDLDRRDFEQLRGLELQAIGAELLGGATLEREAITSMNGFLDASAPLATKSFIDGLDTKSLVIAALTAGFDYLSGAAIVDAKASTQGTHAFSIADLYEA